MAVRGKKLRGNGMWEASRMMLPEHKSAIRSHRVQLHGQPRPELDEQRVEELALALADALASGAVVAVTTYGALGDETAVGVVLKVDPLGQNVKLQCEDDVTWVPLRDIIRIEPAGV